MNHLLQKQELNLTFSFSYRIVSLGAIHQNLVFPITCIDEKCNPI